MLNCSRTTDQKQKLGPKLRGGIWSWRPEVEHLSQRELKAAMDHYLSSGSRLADKQLSLEEKMGEVSAGMQSGESPGEQKWIHKAF